MIVREFFLWVSIAISVVGCSDTLIKEAGGDNIRGNIRTGFFEHEEGLPFILIVGYDSLSGKITAMIENNETRSAGEGLYFNETNRLFLSSYRINTDTVYVNTFTSHSCNLDLGITSIKGRLIFMEEEVELNLESEAWLGMGKKIIFNVVEAYKVLGVDLVKTDKAYFFDQNGVRQNNYIVKGDLLEVLKKEYLGQQEYFYVKYLNTETWKTTKGYIKSEDLRHIEKDLR